MSQARSCSLLFPIREDDSAQLQWRALIQNDDIDQVSEFQHLCPHFRGVLKSSSLVDHARDEVGDQSCVMLWL